ncbi:MAG: hypothetical protein SPJ42_08805, partial [Oscillospiraceae bacterium]|nr:hypothetical protein [Oscillospiraceae bacterium]
MSTLKKVISIVLCISLLAGTVAFVGDLIVPKANAAAGTSNIKSYAELDAQYDGFIYLGLEAYEEDGTLTDGYVQPGDRITYRFYVKSDRFIGNSIPYVTYDNTFFDVTRITDAENPQLIYDVYESQTKVDANPNHPMTSPKGLYGTLTSQPANTIPQIKNGYCGVDATVFNNWDIVKAAWNSDLTKANYPHIMTSDEWLIEWHATVKEGLAEGTKGVSQIVYDLYKI